MPWSEPSLTCKHLPQTGDSPAQYASGVAGQCYCLSDLQKFCGSITFELSAALGVVHSYAAFPKIVALRIRLVFQTLVLCLKVALRTRLEFQTLMLCLKVACMLLPDCANSVDVIDFSMAGVCPCLIVQCHQVETYAVFTGQTSADWQQFF